MDEYDALKVTDGNFNFFKNRGRDAKFCVSTGVGNGENTIIAVLNRMEYFV